MSIEMHDVLSHLRALNLPEDADQMDELRAALLKRMASRAGKP